MVERKSLYVVIGRLEGKNASALADELIASFSELSPPLTTITFDNGLEFADHERISSELGVAIYFVHPYSSWVCGVNENTNGRIRQYFRKGTDLTTEKDEDV